jgi:3-hydroxy-9,10-secoandrosta-1,3,5(10)-triene-9,17-dione monooxygenase
VPSCAWHESLIDTYFTDEEQHLLTQARELVPALSQRAAATNAARDVLAETIAEFHRTGILRIIQPRRFGGLQLRFSLFSQIVEVITEGCASSGWVYAVLGEHQWLLASYPLQAQIDIWGDNPRAVASSSLAPRATAERSAGGWRLSGLFPFSSGSSHAQGPLSVHFSTRLAIPPLSPIFWSPSLRSRSSMTGMCWALPAPAAAR